MESKVQKERVLYFPRTFARYTEGVTTFIAFNFRAMHVTVIPEAAHSKIFFTTGAASLSGTIVFFFSPFL